MIKAPFALLLVPALAGCGESPAERAVAAQLANPDAARFQRVEERGDYVCGEVNGKDEGGGYLGYRRFVYNERLGVALVDPGPGTGETMVDTTDPACGKREAYKSVAERLACAEAPDIARQGELRRLFEDQWQRFCGRR